MGQWVAAQSWTEVAVPAVWKNLPAEVARSGGYAWFRCRFIVPQHWQGRRWELLAEAADDARQYFINGHLVGGVGEFPPNFRSGLGGQERFMIPDGVIQAGQENVFAVRLFQREARMNFNVAAPVLLAGEDAIHLRGTWQMVIGDQEPEAVAANASSAPLFREHLSADQAIATWKLLEGDRGPIAAEEALRHFHTPDDLVVELVLAEPQVRQPLSVKFDARGRLWVLQYLQYPNPAGLRAVSRDKHLRTVWDRIPPPPPHHFVGADKITIHWDSDGDGQFDQHRTFVSGLNLATSFEFDRDGLWVLNPPYLLFYPDRDHDDCPDGDPEVHLEGFGLEDSHSLTNNLRWGPDGWLYAAQGSTVTADVRRYGTQEPPVHSMGQLIWRYHPPTRRYEIFAEGGGNAFGVEFDSAGHLFSGHNGGDTRGFHYVQGGYYQKGFGKHGELSNPYAFGYFPPMRHHAVPRFTHTFVIYEGGALPEKYQGVLFGVAPLLSHVVMSAVEPDGSTFKTRDLGLALSSDDPWFRPVDIQLGPDGAIYICDFYEQRIDHASHYQGRIHRESGRIYRLRAKQPPPATRTDWQQATADELLHALESANRWQRQTALRLIRERRDLSMCDSLRRVLHERQDATALGAFWALYALLGADESLLLDGMRHPSAPVRMWSVRLAGDQRQVSSRLGAELTAMAARETDPQVRSQLACTARRLPADVALAMVKQLVQHDADVNDPHIPLLLWWAIESHAEQDRSQVLALLADEEFWNRPIVRREILERLMRRYASTGRRRDLITAAEILALAPDADTARPLIAGFEQAYQGRLLNDLPEELIQQLARFGGGSFVLKLRQGDQQALQECLQRVSNRQTPKSERLMYVQVLGQIRHEPAIGVLLQLVAEDNDTDIRVAALSALGAFSEERIAEALITGHDQLPADVREAAEATLVSRPAWASKLLDAVENGRCRQPLAKSTIARLQLAPEKELQQRARTLWADDAALATQEQRQLMERIEEVLLGAAGNPYRGRTLFMEHCGKCHKLFQSGGQIGPDLTAYRRDDIRRMVANIVNPSLEIREGYENYLVITTDGRTLNGFLADQDNQTITLRSADGQTTTIPRGDIDDMYAVPKSIMPEGILNNWAEQDIRDLFAYLRATQPLPE